MCIERLVHLLDEVVAEAMTIANAESRPVFGVFPMGAMRDIGITIHFEGDETARLAHLPYLDAFLGGVVAAHLGDAHLLQGFCKMRLTVCAIGAHKVLRVVALGLATILEQRGLHECLQGGDHFMGTGYGIVDEHGAGAVFAAQGVFERVGGQCLALFFHGCRPSFVLDRGGLLAATAKCE